MVGDVLLSTRTLRQKLLVLESWSFRHPRNPQPLVLWVFLGVCWAAPPRLKLEVGDQLILLHSLRLQHTPNAFFATIGVVRD